MKTQQLLVLTLVAAALLTGCEKRSISNSGYVKPGAPVRPGEAPGSDSAFTYRGELSEFDVLGITRGMEASDEEIGRALTAAKRIQLHADSSILLIQSGALFPDGPMVTELSKSFRVIPFSGVPPESRVSTDAEFERSDAGSFSRSLRLAAARGGNDLILCYWGVLESQNNNLPTRTVSWIPIVGWMTPDQREHMRIRLKMALIDVRTGGWAVFSPEPVELAKLSIRPRREAADQKLVEDLKREAYVAAARKLVEQYSEIASTR